MREHVRPSWFVLLVVVLLLGAVALSGCGRSGQPSAPSGGGSQATTRTMVLDTVVQWATTKHSVVLTLPAEEDGCKNCHDGYMFSITGGGFQPRVQPSAATTGSTGTTGSTTATGSTTTSAPLAATLPAPTDCRACHSGAGAQIADRGTVEQIPNISAAKGGLGALCMACHNGWHQAGKGQDGALTAPHYSTQTDVMYGVNFVDPGGAGSTNTTASESPHLKIENTCVGCHMAPATEGGGANHTFKVANYASCQAEGCHDGDMTGGGTAKSDYDGDGDNELVTEEVDGLLDALKRAIEAEAGTFESARGQIAFTSGRSVADATYAAAYNYFYVLKDKSRGIHNTRFVVDLLTRSIRAAGGQVSGSSGGTGSSGGSGSSGSSGTTGSTGTTGSGDTTP